MTHPLTEEMMDKIHGDDPGYSNPYDEDDMRAAADWQLEWVIKWLRKNLDERYVYIDFDDGDVLAPGIDVESVIDDIKQAMRPTQDNK